VVAAFEAGGIDLPIDYQHQNDRHGQCQNGPVPAAGWIKAMKVEADGIWGRVEWTARARELLANKEYRFLSPVVLFDPTDQKITKIKGASLVHNPALRLTALASQEDAMPDQTNLLQRFAAALNLPADSTADELMAALEKVIKTAAATDPAKFVPIKALHDVLKDRNTHLAKMIETRAQSKVEEAMRRGFLTPAMKDWATALCAQDEASFDSFLKTSVPRFAHLSAQILPDAHPPSEVSTGARSAEAQAVCTQLGLEPDALER